MGAVYRVSSPLRPVGYHQLQAAQDGGGHVIGVAFYGCGHLQQFAGGIGVVAQVVGGHQATGNGRRAAAHAPAQGNGVVAAEAKGGHFQAGLVEKELQGAKGEVGGIDWQFCPALTGNLHEVCTPTGTTNCAVVGGNDLQPVPQVQCHAKAVKPRAKIGRGGGGQYLKWLKVVHHALRGRHSGRPLR